MPQRVEATRSAVAMFKRLLYLLAEHHELFLPEVTPVWEALERESAAAVPARARSRRGSCSTRGGPTWPPTC